MLNVMSYQVMLNVMITCWETSEEFDYGVSFQVMVNGSQI